jgi:tetratricopeptide (TPR) repeat protein/SAM-dependent methyltransferase
MNRKQRRAAAKHGGTGLGGRSVGREGVPSAAELADIQASGLAHHRAGRLEQAQACYRKVLAVEPSNVNALHLLGVLARQVGQPAAAADLISKAIALNDRLPEPHNNLGNALQELGRGPDAEACYRKALTLKPDYAAAHNNLGNALQARGELVQSEACYRRALALMPDYVEAHNNLGVTLLEQGKPVEAEACYRQALTLKPDYAEAYSNLGNALCVQGRTVEGEACCRRALALKPDYPAGHNNLGNALKDQGRLDEAEACHRGALALKPDFPEAVNNLGIAFRDRGNLAEAEACFRRAIALKPGIADAYGNLGNLLLDLGDVTQALEVAQHALAARETRDAKALFVRCISRSGKATSIPIGDDLRRNLLRALTEPWGRPSELAVVAATALKQDAAIGPCIRRANDAWPRRLSGPELLGASGLAAICDDQLLLCLLVSGAVCDMELERFLTLLRFVLLESAAASTAPISIDEGMLKLCCALAQQCFVNEYVFALADGELDRASRLREAVIAGLESGGPVPALWLVAVAAYVPLDSLPAAATILDRSWPQATAGLLTQQVREPREDLQARASIPRLTPVLDDVSLLVQQQYEENPYPRWVRTASMLKPTTVDVYLRRQLPLARFRPFDKVDGLEILIAGCGTGQHSIETAQRFIGTDILAVDLSLTSLCYAQRKSHALGLRNVQYAQADILQLGSIGRTFDMIEAGGVLHHLADPLAGWRVLLSILRPGGVMRVGLYSKLARSHIVAAQTFIAERGYGRSADDIRRFRQDLMRSATEMASKIASECRDFFSTSECRDLLFHRQEHRFTLPEIRAFLAQSGLEFLGFDIEGRSLEQFRRRYPDGPAQTDLGLWDAFEAENPSTFSGMYQFYVQKP